MADSYHVARSPQVTLPASEQWEVSSVADGYSYKVLLAHPEGPARAEGHPVIYVLDGDAIFATVVEAVRMRARRPDVTGVEATAVVGIASSLGDPKARQRRHYDYTPGPAFGGSFNADAPTGGASAFMDILLSVIVPEVSRRVSVDSRRQTIFGHSLAGLFVLNALAAPSPFSCFAAASPSIWWDPPRLLEIARSVRPGAGSSPRVLITVGEYEEKLGPREVGRPSSEEILRRRSERRMVTGSGEVAAAMAAAGATVHFEIFPGEDHASSALLSVNRLLHFTSEPVDFNP